MKSKTITLAVGLCFVAAIAASASIPQVSHIGTWKLNETKSKLPAGATKNHTVVYEAAGDNIKVTVDGVDRDGKPVHHEWTGKFDGKEYPVTGDSTSDTRSYKLINERTVEFTAKKDGKVNLAGRVMVSADGKTRTVTTSAIDAQGKKVKSTAIYDKQ
jgi:hypothetical protein